LYKKRLSACVGKDLSRERERERANVSVSVTLLVDVCVVHQRHRTTTERRNVVATDTTAPACVASPPTQAAPAPPAADAADADEEKDEHGDAAERSR